MADGGRRGLFHSSGLAAVDPDGSGRAEPRKPRARRVLGTRHVRGGVFANGERPRVRRRPAGRFVPTGASPLPVPAGRRRTQGGRTQVRPANHPLHINTLRTAHMPRNARVRPASRPKTILCSPQSLNREVEVVRAGLTAGHFPSNGVGIRAATALISDGAANKERPCIPPTLIRRAPAERPRVGLPSSGTLHPSRNAPSPGGPRPESAAFPDRMTPPDYAQSSACALGPMESRAQALRKPVIPAKAGMTG